MMTALENTAILYTVNDKGVATIALNKPEVRNAFDDEMVNGLVDALNQADQDDAVRCVILTSTHEKIFSAGGNLNGFAAQESLLTKHQRNYQAPRMMDLIRKISVPVLCALNGHALAGGFGLIMACDLVVAKQGVRIGTPEINIGAFPFIISALMKRNIPQKKVMEMLFLGEQMPVEEAHSLGMINRVVEAEDFDETIRDWSERLASKSPLMIKLGKQALCEQENLSLTESFNLLQHYLTLAQNTEDVKEGVAAFMEKREPIWKGC